MATSIILKNLKRDVNNEKSSKGNEKTYLGESGVIRGGPDDLLLQLLVHILVEPFGGLGMTQSLPEALLVLFQTLVGRQRDFNL